MKRGKGRFTKGLVLVVLTILVAMSMLACGKKDEAEKSLTVKDSTGSEVTINKEVERVVSVGPNITEIICKLGAQDKLVGRTDYCDYPTSVTDIPSIGSIYTPDMEKIISLQPDVVVASTHFSDENAQKLKDLNIPVIVLYEEYEVTGVYDMITILGDVLGKQEEAKQTVEEMKATIDDVTSKVSALTAPTVYYVVSFGEGGDYSAPENTFTGQLLGLAGGKNIVPASDSWAYSLEALLEADPQIIIVPVGMKDTFMGTKAYETLSAVKNGTVYEIDNNLLDRQGNRNAEGVLALAKIFHPEAFK